MKVAIILVLAFVALASAYTPTAWCTWYGETSAPGCTDASISILKASFDLTRQVCGSITAGGCAPGCLDTTGLLACKICSPTQYDKPVCKTFCLKQNTACGTEALNSLCDAYSTAQDCWNSATSVAISAVFVALVALLALLF